MREPKGWQAVSDEVAGERLRAALHRTGREVAATPTVDSKEAVEP
jgi:hypothetical protein